MIEDNFSKPIYALTRVPYLVRIKVAANRSFISTSSGEPFRISATEVKATIEDVIKGHNRFQVGEGVKFIYMNFWNKSGAEFPIEIKSW